MRFLRMVVVVLNFGLILSANAAEPITVDVRAAEGINLKPYGAGNLSLFIESDTDLELRLYVADLDDIVTITVRLQGTSNGSYLQRRPRRKFFVVPKVSGEIDALSGKHLFLLFESPEGCRVQYVDTIAVAQGFVRLRITPPKGS